MEAIIRLGLSVVTILLLGVNLATTYCFKSGVILKSWPKVNVCLLSNSYRVMSSKIEEFLVRQVLLVNPVMLVILITPVDLVAQVDLKN